jgi:hypothetical protein
MQGIKAVDMLCDMMDGKNVPELIQMPSHLIVRRSCGCDSRVSLLETGFHGPYQTNRKSREEQMESVKNSIFTNLMKDRELQADIPRCFYDGEESISRVLDLFLKDMKTPERNSLFIQEILLSSEKEYLDSYFLEFLKILVTKIHRYSLPHFSNDKILASRIDDLFHNAIYLLLDAMSRLNQNLNRKTRDLSLAILNVTRTLSTAFTLNELRDTLRELLPTLDIPFCFIALYMNEDDGRKAPSKKASVFLHYRKDGTGTTIPSDTEFETSLVFPDGLMSEEEKFSVAVLPLFTEDEHFGYIVFNFTPDQDPIIYEALQGHISPALKGAFTRIPGQPVYPGRKGI